MTKALSQGSAGSSPSPSHLRSVSVPSRPASAPSTISSSADESNSAEQLKRALYAYEQQLAAAHREGLALQLNLRTFQADSGLSPITGHRIFAKLDEAQARVSAAISDTATGHNMIRTLAIKIGVAPTLYGERTDPESEEAEERRNSTGGLGGALSVAA